MSEHSMFIMSTGQGTWAECECGWASQSCESAGQASVQWSDHLRKESARETLRKMAESKK